MCVSNFSGDNCAVSRSIILHSNKRCSPKKALSAIEWDEMREDNSVAIASTIDITPSFLIPKIQAQLSSYSRYNSPEHHQAQLLEFRHYTVLLVLFSRIACYTYPPISTPNIKSTLISPDNSPPLLYPPVSMP